MYSTAIPMNYSKFIFAFYTLFRTSGKLFRFTSGCIEPVQFKLYFAVPKKWIHVRMQKI